MRTVLILGVSYSLAACSSTPTTTPPDGGGDAGQDSAVTGPHARVFATSTTYTGSLKTNVTGAASGPAAADSLCQQAATAAGLTGTFVAWLSDSTTNAKDRVKDVSGGWYTVGADMKFGSDVASLLSSGPTAPIKDEKGNAVINCEWTGTLADGTKATTGISGGDGLCNGWTSNGTDFGVVDGLSSAFNDPSGCSTGTIAAGGVVYSQCSNSLAIYCFQQ